MVKKFSLNCNAGSEKVVLDFYVGDPQDNSHPIGFQMKFLSQKGISVPENVVQSLANLHQIAKQNAIPFDDILDYVSGQLNLEDVVANAFDNASKFSDNSAIKNSQ